MAKNSHIAYVIQESPCLLTVEETAKRLGIARKTLYNRISRKAENRFPVKCKRFMGKPMFMSTDITRFIEGLPYENAVDKVSSEQE